MTRIPTSEEPVLRRITKSNPTKVLRESHQEALDLFHAMAQRVPAYQSFLKEQGINPQEIQTYDEFLRVPPTDKDNYISKYSLEELSWDGKLDAMMLSTSSGASGEPNFWPRGDRLETETALVYELMLRHIFGIDQKKTLVINAYSMGLYVAGTFTLNSCIRIARKGYPLTVITPGIHKDDVLRIVDKIGDQFEQIVLCAYPPLAKDIIDAGKLAGIDWSKYTMRFISGGEAYSEKWRDKLYESAGVQPENYLTSTVNTYGSADAAILGHETPVSILIRKWASEQPALCKELFGKERVPSFHQYYPFFKDISDHQGELCFTANAGIPLARYNIHDAGGYYTWNEMLRILKKHGIKESDINDTLPSNQRWRLPFVYLYGRSYAGATIYGLNIYPENIKVALEDDDVFPHVSGKFRISTEYNRAQDQFLRIVVETQHGKKIDRRTAQKIRKKMYDTLRAVNLEFKMLSDTFPKKARPKVLFVAHGNPKHFPTRIKEQYLKK